MEENVSENDVKENESSSTNKIELEEERNEGAKRLKTEDESSDKSDESSSNKHSSSVSNTEHETETTETDVATTSNRCPFKKAQNLKTRNYRNRMNEDDSSRSSMNDNETDSANLNNLNNNIRVDPASTESELDSSFSTVINDTESDSDAEELAVLKKQKPKHNFHVVPQIINRQIGCSLRMKSNELFQRRFYGCLHCVQRLELMYKLEKHSGCVNSLNFHQTGSLLASGSDDLKVVIWDWKLGTALLDFESKHRNNIFQSKFLPLSGDLHIVTCARDGQVRLAQVAVQEGLRSTRKLGCHQRPCHKLAIMQDQPQVILSAGEDGAVLSHDIRVDKATRIVTVKADYREVPLYSIHSRPLNSNEFCVSGHDHFVRTYDQRKCDDNLPPLNLYFPKKIQTDDYIDLHVTCALYNYNGSEILASYNDDDIYLFDVNGSQGTFAHQYQGHRNGATIKGVNFFGPKSEYIISGSDCGNIYIWDKNTESIVNWMLGDDNGVVNCLEPHPQLPFLCTSGLDWDIKVWVPSCENDPTMKGLAETIKSNTKAKGGCFSSRISNESQMLWILWRHLRSSNRLQRGGPVYESSNSTSSTASDGMDSDDAESLNLETSPGCATS